MPALQRSYAVRHARGEDRLDDSAIDTIPANAPRDETLLRIDETKLPDRRNYPETEPDYRWHG